MTRDTRTPTASWRTLQLPLIVLALGLFITGLETRLTWQAGYRNDQERFQTACVSAWERIEDHLEMYQHCLERYQDFFESHWPVSEGEWRHLVSISNIRVDCAAIDDLGFALNAEGGWTGLRPEEIMIQKLPSCTLAERVSHDYRYQPILLRWRAGGLDPRPYGEPRPANPWDNRAFSEAGKLGVVTMSPPRIVWTNTAGIPVKGVTFVAPTYRRGMTEAKDADMITAYGNREAELRGLIFASFTMDRLLASIFGTGPYDVWFELYDGIEPVPERLMNQFPPPCLAAPAGTSLNADTTDGKAGIWWRPAFRTSQIHPNYGNKLLSRFYSTPYFDLHSSTFRAWKIAALGSVLSFAFAGLVLGQTLSRNRAVQLAGALRESHELLQRARVQQERVSRDLHDGTVQSLYAVGLGLSRVRRRLGTSSKEGRQIGNALGELDALILDLRGFLIDLDPGVAPLKTPEATLGALVERLRKTVECEIELKVADGFHAELPTLATLNLLQAAREGVSNALRHGHAQRVELALSRRDDRVVLEVRDDGTGFDSRENRNGSGRGLENLRHRAQTHDGRFEVHSKLGGPTCLCFEIKTDA